MREARARDRRKLCACFFDQGRLPRRISARSAATASFAPVQSPVGSQSGQRATHRQPTNAWFTECNRVELRGFHKSCRYSIVYDMPSYHIAQRSSSYVARVMAWIFERHSTRSPATRVVMKAEVPAERWEGASSDGGSVAQEAQRTGEGRGLAPGSGGGGESRHVRDG